MKLSRRAATSPVAQPKLFPETHLVSQPWVEHKTINGVLANGGSGEGWHQSMADWVCPERMRQRILGTYRAFNDPELNYEGDELTPLAMGSMWHYLMEAHGHGLDGISVLHRVAGIPPLSVEKLETLYLGYLERWGESSWEILGTEAKIRVPIPGIKRVWRLNPITGKGRFVTPYYSVRYDKIVRSKEGLIISVEHKTTSRFGSNTLLEWKTSGQIIGQAWAWTQHPANQELGPIYQTLMDFAVKTITPDYHREPLLVRRAQMKRFERSVQAWTLMRESFEKKYGLDKPWPRTWACTDRYSVCPFADLCHEGAWQLYSRLYGPPLDTKDIA